MAYLHMSNKLKPYKTMKRVFSLVAVMLLMSVAYSASAQSLVGKWTTNLKTVEGVVAERSVINEFDGGATVEFFSDGTAKTVAQVSSSIPLDATVTANFDMSVVSDGTWVFDGETLKMKVTGLSYTVDSLGLTPSNPEFEMMIPMLKQAIEEQVNTNAQAAKELQMETTAKIEFVSENEIIYTDTTAGVDPSLTGISVHYYRVVE
jgi:hypothetical protein